MTIIQPQPKSILNKLLLIMFLLVALFSVVLVILYNYFIDLEQKIKVIKNEIKKMEAENVVMKESLFNVLSSENLKKIAEKNGLIEDKNPTYLEIKENEKNQWQVGLNF